MLYCLDALRYEGKCLLSIRINNTSLLGTLFLTKTSIFDLLISTLTNSYSIMNNFH